MTSNTRNQSTDSQAMPFYVTPRQFALYLSIGAVALGLFLMFGVSVAGGLVLAALGGIGTFAAMYVGVRPQLGDDDDLDGGDV